MAIKFTCYDRDGNENPELQKAVEQTQVRLDELARSWEQSGVVPSTLDLDRLEDAIAEARHKGLGIEWTTVGSMSSFFDSLSEQERQDIDRLRTSPTLPANDYDTRASSDYTPDWLAEVGRLQEENKNLRHILASLIQHAGGEIHVPDEFLVSPSHDAQIATEHDVERCVTIYRLV